MRLSVTRRFVTPIRLRDCHWVNARHLAQSAEQQ